MFNHDECGRFSAILYKGDNIGNFLWAFLDCKPHLKRGLLYCVPKGSKFFPIYSRPFFRREVKSILAELPPRKDLHLTHLCLETPKRVIGKHCRPRSNAAECGV